jgi:hypothetical protein
MIYRCGRFLGGVTLWALASECCATIGLFGIKLMWFNRRVSALLARIGIITVDGHLLSV